MEFTPNIGLGEPLLGNGTTGVFFPTMLLHMVLPAKWAWVAGAIVINWLAGFGVALLVIKRVGLASRSGSHSEPYGALVAAVIFMMCILFVDFARISAINALALLPWAMLSSAALLSRITAARLVGTTLLFLLIFLAGDNAASAGILLSCVGYVIFKFTHQPRDWTKLAGAILTLADLLFVKYQWLIRRENTLNSIERLVIIATILTSLAIVALVVMLVVIVQSLVL